MIIKYFCDDCGNELDQYIEDKLSDKITETILKDSPLTYLPNDIYFIDERDEYDIIEYDYIKTYIKYKCPKCGKILA